MNKKVGLLAMGATCIAAGFFLLTNPNNVPVGVLMIPVILAFLVCASVSLLIFRLLGVQEGKARKQQGISLMIGVMASLFLVFQSTGGLVVGDIILASLIFIVGYLYISKY